MCRFENALEKYKRDSFSNIAKWLSGFVRFINSSVRHSFDPLDISSKTTTAGRGASADILLKNISDFGKTVFFESSPARNAPLIEIPELIELFYHPVEINKPALKLFD